MTRPTETGFINHYRHCGEEWSDEWSCACNDRCPVCNKEIEPYESDVEGECEPADACQHMDDGRGCCRFCREPMEESPYA